MKQVVSLFGAQTGDLVGLNEQAQAHAAELGLEYRWVPMQSFERKQAIEALQAADAAIIDVDPYDESMFREIGPRIRMLVRFGVGYDAVDLQAATRHGIAVARTPGANSGGVAELALTMMLALKRNLLAHHSHVREGRWQKHMASELAGSTVGIVGFGAVGRRLGQRLSGFECTLLAHDPHPDREAAARMGVRLTSLESLFEASDAVSLHLPCNQSTDKIVNADLIGRMKPSAVIVNTSRGGVVDEGALFEALKARRIAGAGLDVFTVEPVAPDNPLLGLDNVLLSPHVASFTRASFWNTYEMALRTIADFFAGKPCDNILNKDYAAGGR